MNVNFLTPTRAQEEGMLSVCPCVRDIMLRSQNGSKRVSETFLRVQWGSRASRQASSQAKAKRGAFNTSSYLVSTKNVLVCSKFHIWLRLLFTIYYICGIL